MPGIDKVGRVMVPVADQDAAIAFYTQKLGFELSADAPFGAGERWVEVTPPGRETSLALVPAQGEYQPGRMTGIALDTSAAAALKVDLAANGVDVDAEAMGGEGAVPLLFFLRDPDGNVLMVVEQ